MGADGGLDVTTADAMMFFAQAKPFDDGIQILVSHQGGYRPGLGRGEFRSFRCVTFLLSLGRFYLYEQFQTTEKHVDTGQNPATLHTGAPPGV